MSKSGPNRVCAEVFGGVRGKRGMSGWDGPVDLPESLDPTEYSLVLAQANPTKKWPNCEPVRENGVLLGIRAVPCPSFPWYFCFLVFLAADFLAFLSVFFLLCRDFKGSRG